MDQQHQPLTDRIAEAVRTVRLRLGRNSLAIVKAGGTVPLSGGEADDVAAAVMAEIGPELAARDAENAKLRAELENTREVSQELAAQLRNYSNALSEARAERDEAIEQRDTLSDVNTTLHAETLAQGNALLRARAAHESVVLEAQRQAKRADQAEARTEETIALSHSWLYHRGYPCPTPGNCFGGTPDPTRPRGCTDCGGQTRGHPGHYPTCPTRTAPARPAD